MDRYDYALWKQPIHQDEECKVLIWFSALNEEHCSRAKLDFRTSMDGKLALCNWWSWYYF